MARDDEQIGTRPACQHFGHDLLGEKGRAFDADGLVFLARANVKETHRDVFGAPAREFFRVEEHLLVRLVAFLDLRDHFVDVQASIARAKRLEGFARLKATA